MFMVASAFGRMTGRLLRERGWPAGPLVQDDLPAHRIVRRVHATEDNGVGGCRCRQLDPEPAGPTSVDDLGSETAVPGDLFCPRFGPGVGAEVTR
jgi:hypothetical protein